MQRERFQRMEELFQAAVELPIERRTAFLASAAADDPALHESVLRLLTHADAGSPLSGILDGLAAPDHAQDEPEGARVGPYRLVERLGQGGFGAVYAAEQEHPVRRRVALKIIKLGMDTRRVIARFEAERQALAMMEHPNIATVLDAGATESGRPYFVMELVRGEAITAYCDRHAMTVDDRLDLFLDVCAAVQHAHTKGVIHRDLKPSNVLVSEREGRAVAKVIDFGIAKATAARDPSEPFLTDARQPLGTPEYMSPEQAAGSPDLDTRTDVYSLGVLLYELLTGTTPLDGERLRSADLAGVQRILGEDEPPRPSMRLSTIGALAEIAARRQLEPGRLRSVLRGDLDWIVMRCLEKDRSRRYETAHDLAADLRRHRRHEPVSASPPGAGYRIAKFIRRHRKAVAGAAAVAAALLIGLIGTTSGVFWAMSERGAALQAATAANKARTLADEQRRSAEEQKQAAQTVIRLLDEMLQPRNDEEEGDELSFKGHLDAFSAGLASRVRGQPAIEATVRQSLANAYRSLRASDAAETEMWRVLDLWRAASGDSAPETYAAADMLTNVAAEAGHIGAAVADFRAAHARAALAHGDGSQQAMSWAWLLSGGLVLNGQSGDAEGLLIRVIDHRRAALGAEHPETTHAQARLAWALHLLERRQESAALYRQVNDVERRTLGAADPRTCFHMQGLTRVLTAAGDWSGAIQVVEANAAEARSRGGESPVLADLLFRQAHLARYVEDLEETRLSLSREALSIWIRTLGPDHLDSAACMVQVGDHAYFAGRPDEAAAAFEQALAMLRRHGEAGRLKSAHCMYYLGNIARDSRNDLAEAERLYRLATDTNPLGARVHHFDLAITLFLAGNGDEAAQVEAAAIDRFRDPSGPKALVSADLFANQALHFARLGRLGTAERLARAALTIRMEVAPDHWRRWDSASRLAGVLIARAERSLDTDPRGADTCLTEAAALLIEALARMLPPEPERQRLLEAQDRLDAVTELRRGP